MYDDAPATARVPLASEDVEALLLTDGAEIAGNPRRVRHLLTRVRATMAAHTTKVRLLQRDLEVIREGAQRTSNAVAGALDALARCSLDEQRQVYDRRAQVLLDTIAQAQRAGDDARVAAASETNRARLALAQAAAFPGLTPAAQEHVGRCLAQIPIMRRPVTPAPAAPAGGFVVPAADAGPELNASLFA